DRKRLFRSIWIQPAAGDAGGALGGALFAWHQLLEKPRTVGATDSQSGSFLGPSYSDEEIGKFLASRGVRATPFGSDEELIRAAAKELADGRIVGWFQGRMEFGPRALGARSILGDARSPKMQSSTNLRIKFRESFRPFAPAVLQEYTHEWFAMDPGQESP